MVETLEALAELKVAELIFEDKYKNLEFKLNEYQSNNIYEIIKEWNIKYENVKQITQKLDITDMVFKEVSGFPVGFLRVLGVPTSVQVFIGCVSLLFMATSLVALFENRSNCILSNPFRITKQSTRFLYYLFNCTLIIGYLIPTFCNIPEQESAKLFLLQTIPCPTEEFFYTEVFVWTIDKFWNNYIWVASGSIVLIILFQIIFYAICCVYYLYFSTAVIISPKTRKYQRSFFLGTVAQVVVPFIFYVIPLATVISFFHFDYYNQAFNNSIALFLSFHGFASSSIITLVHHPYRTFLIKVVTFNRGPGKSTFYFPVIIDCF
ncbi:hypothetical protein CRE_20469 [Caenorhabditis remanei]|uniref:Serpentine Receptor, class H n=1 Tax=Caenorhabditis remanei TaxID=31234 RepID=E3N2W7_CAERE|nr:hypothetical protein CRE_20469 [Caenorhabditis remanei]